MPYTIPSDTHLVGDLGHTTDHNNAIDVLRGMGAVYNVLNTTYAGGADPTGAADSAAAIQAAINAVPAAGGTVYLPAGTYKVASTLTVTAKYVHIRGDGRWATTISFTGTGDCLRIYNTDTTGVLTGGGVRDLAIDGTSAGAGSTGLHYGDQRAGELRLAVQNFSGAGSMGAHLDNQYAWTEECHGYLWLSNNTQNLVFDVSGNTTSTNSFGYTDLATEIIARVNQDGVVLQNGALLYNSRLTVRANFQGSSSAQTNAVLRITGTVPAGHPNAGSSAQINSCRLDVMAECGSGTGSNVPQTLVLGTLGGNVLVGCTGILDFATGALAFATTNWTALGATGGFIFSGIIRGDFNLNNASVGTGITYLPANTGAFSFGKSLLSQANGNMSVAAGDFFQQTLNQNITVNLNPGGAACPAAAQRKTIVIIQAAAGGPYTVTWPSTGSPTVNNPTIKWPAGVAPVMSATASAVDVYHLDTYDGATWYGRASQGDGAGAAITYDGVEAAGALGKPADAGHVHPTAAYNSLWVAPSAATAESFPRRHATSVSSALVSGTLYVTAIGLPSGLVVNNITLMTNTTAKTGGSHGWYVLLDSSRVVKAVTADQTDAATVWGVASTTYTLATNAYTTTYNGLYYVGVMVAATQMPTFTTSSGTATGIAGLTPVLGGSSSTAQTTPPSTGTTMAAVSSSAGFYFYAYTS